MDKPFVIALEEHYSDALTGERIGERTGVPTAGRMGEIFDKLTDLEGERLRSMDETGIDVQVLSHLSTPLQQLDPGLAVDLAFETNERLYGTIQRHPNRFAGFAALPTPNPAKAADELERCVTRLGFKGAMLWGRTHDTYHDDKRFWPIFERAEALDVPLYLHPGPPHPGLMSAMADHLEDYPTLDGAPWGYTVDTSTQALRLMLSGLFDAYPRLKIILGHMGEGLPFQIDRMDESLNRPMRYGGKSIALKDIFCRNFYITTSGFFSTPALMCALMTMGIDRILFSVDYPFVENPPAMEWMAKVPLSVEDKEKMFNGNARRLLKIDG